MSTATGAPVGSNGNDTNGTGERRNPLEFAPKRSEIKLISVRLKEAALDSPSFRTSCNYHATQAEQVEMWIDGLLKSLKKYPQHYTDFSEVNSVLLNQLIPDFLKSTTIDQDNTLSVMDCTKMNLNSLWSTSLKDLALNEAEITAVLTEFTKRHVKPFKEARKSFEFLQTKYDTTLSKYSALSKLKDPSALREDSFQLHEVRKAYIAASLEICQETAKFLETLDSTLMQLSEIMFKGRSTFDERYYLRVQSWSQALSKSIDLLLEDMKNSRATIEKSTIAQFEPSRDIKDHNPANINPATLTKPVPGTPSSFEKHGWLYMKTTVGKPARTIWVRRWVFVKSGIFGMLVISPSKTFVQETDKVGVLLANVRYAADEDRRFCFEIKTIDFTIMLQAETLKELKEWLYVFSEEKKRAIESSNSESGKYAFGRYPPLLYEFACTSLTSTDQELTTSRAENANNDDDTYTTVTSSHLATLVGQKSDEHDFSFANSDSSEFRNPDLNTPIATARSKLALVSHAFLDPTVVPTAVTANIWGSVNWGMYYMDETLMSRARSTKNTNNITSLAKKTQYPSYYPPHLINYDLQLKSLFDASAEPDELVVIHFACLWTLNNVQELAGCAFITTKNVYFYMNSTGFVSLLKRPLEYFVAVDVTSEKLWDWIKVYNINGLSMKGRIFLTDGKIIQKKFDMLINNMAEAKPLPEHELIPLLESIEAKETLSGEKLDRHQSKRHKEKSPSPRVDDELSTFQPFSGFNVGGHRMRTNFRDEYDLNEVVEFDAPAKAVFHIIYGEYSTLAKDTVFLASADEFKSSPWHPDGNVIRRDVDYKLSLSNGVLKGDGYIPGRLVQTIEEMVDSKYYRIEEEKKILFSGDKFRWLRKIVIIATDAKSCKVLYYSKVAHKKKRSSFFLRQIFGKSIRHFQRVETQTQINIVKNRVKKLGTHGQVLKAIRTYGHLSQSDEPYKNQEEVLFHLTIIVLFKYYTKTGLYLLTGFIMNIFALVGHLLTKLFVSLSMNWFLLLLLTGSVGFNLFLVGRSTFSYWKERRHEHVVKSLRSELELTQLQRSISLSDMDVLTQLNYNTTTPCFGKFMSSQVIDQKSSAVDSKLREKRHEIAVKRNDLVVELKILEQVEKELIVGNFRNFVLAEINMCKISLDEMGVENDELEIYCSSCIDDYKNIAAGLF